jgi:hypothetical protein
MNRVRGIERAKRVVNSRDRDVHGRWTRWRWNGYDSSSSSSSVWSLSPPEGPQVPRSLHVRGVRNAKFWKVSILEVIFIQ